MIDIRELLVFHGEERPARHHFDASLLAASDQGSRRIALHDHGADEDIVSPGQVLVGQVGHIQVNQSFFPLGRQHGGHGQQAQGGRAGLLVDKPQGVLETPKGVWKFRINQQDFHCCLILLFASARWGVDL